MTAFWATHATRAALDRYATGRALDPAFIARLETDTVTTVLQCGGDVLGALDALHLGLAAAADACPACGGVTRGSDHGPVCDTEGCPDPWSPADGVVRVPKPRDGT